MKKLVLENYATMFPGIFTPYVSLKDVDGTMYREVFFECDATGERANHAVSDDGREMVLSSSVRKNYSFGLDIWTAIAEDAEKVPMDSLT